MSIKLKNIILFDQAKFCTRIHNAKLENGIKYQPGVMHGYICNMCREVNKAQYNTAWNNQMKFDMWSSRVWTRSMKNAVKFDGVGQLVSIQNDREAMICQEFFLKRHLFFRGIVIVSIWGGLWLTLVLLKVQVFLSISVAQWLGWWRLQCC